MSLQFSSVTSLCTTLSSILAFRPLHRLRQLRPYRTFVFRLRPLRKKNTQELACVALDVETRLECRAAGRNSLLQSLGHSFIRYQPGAFCSRMQVCSRSVSHQPTQ